jgi:hypothetical protein
MFPSLQRLVTFDPSTFSSYLVEHRLLHLGVPRDTATCVFGLCKKVPDPKVRLEIFPVTVMCRPVARAVCHA